ncbi:MAG: hypothetical protein JJD92_16605 [Frankiaceae bacterium]|nr:hypothetical protein [Frankiaceae bacterium]
MGGNSVLIVPATVPSAIVRRLLHRAPESPVVHTVDPYPVPPARAIRVVPDLLTPEQVAQLREENDLLRRELARVRAS